MDENTKPRIRINAKQTSKGEWYFDITAETESVELSSDLLASAVQEIEAKFVALGKKLVSQEG